MSSSAVQDEENPEKIDLDITPVRRSARRPDIDCIRVGLTWGILLYHSTIAFLPEEGWYITNKYSLGPVLHPLVKVFKNFMLIWNMPMFFFLSGVSSYFALFKRSEQQYRDERVHRLMVPYLFSFFYMWMYGITYFGPNCAQYFALKESGVIVNG